MPDQHSKMQSLFFSIALLVMSCFALPASGQEQKAVAKQEKKPEKGDVKKPTVKGEKAKGTTAEADAKRKADKAKADKGGVEEHGHDHDHEDETATKKDAVDLPDGPYDPLTAQGILDDIQKPLAKILKIKRKGEGLIFDLPDSYQEADQSFREIRTKSSGGGGGHGSTTYWTQYFSGQNMGGRIQKGEQNFGRGKPNAERFVAEFVEASGRNRELEVYGESDSEFLIRINGGADPFLMQINQSKSGFFVQYTLREKAFAGGADSFEKFCRRYPAFVQQSLLPLLKKFGFTAPVTRFNSVTRDHVIDLLMPIDPQRVEKFNNTFADLESTKYADREAATEKLRKEYEQWKDVVRASLANETFSVEVQSRMQKLIKEKSSPSDRELVSLVTSGNLKNDAEYLVWLLEQTREKETTDDSKVKTTQIVKQLEKVTEKELGSELAAWKKWLREDDKTELTSVNAEGQNPLATTKGYLTQMAVPTANLLSLKLDNGRARLDREFWAEQFNGESIKTILDRVKADMKKSNLPDRWLSVSFNDMNHEHVLLEHIQTALPPQMQSNYYSYGNISGNRSTQKNRRIEQPHLLVLMDLELTSEVDRFGRKTKDSKTAELFRYQARERNESNMLLSLVEHKDTSLQIIVGSRKDNALLQIYQQPDGKTFCHLMSGASVKSVSAGSFQKLFEKEGKFLTTEVYPILSRFGIQVPKELGGPLEFKKIAPATNKNR